MIENIRRLDGLACQLPGLPSPRDGYVQLWRSISGPVRPDGGSGETFSSNNGSYAQNRQVSASEPDFAFDFDPDTKVEGLPVFLDPQLAIEWGRPGYRLPSNGERKVSRPRDHVGCMAVIACAEVPITLFDTIVQIYRNECFYFGTQPVTYPVSVSEVMERQLSGAFDSLQGEHYIPEYPDFPAQQGIRTSYFVFDRYDLNGGIAQDAELIPYADNGHIPNDVSTQRRQESSRPRYDFENQAAAMRDADPWCAP